MPEHLSKNYTEKVYNKMLREKGLSKKEESFNIKVKLEDDEKEEKRRRPHF